MKTNNAKSPLLKFFTYTFMMFALAIFLVSCDKDDSAINVTESSEASLFEIIDYNTSSPVLNRKGAPKKGDASIAQIAIGVEGEFDELVAALAYVDANITPSPNLVDLFLNGTDQYTVFAPTDAAFLNLYENLSTDEVTIDEISDLPADLVLNVLLYHVTDGRRATNSVLPKNNTKTIETLNGESFEVTTDPMIDAINSDAMFVLPLVDVSASNGIIHVIDTVLLPTL